jgi:hypothetical protein
VFDLQNVPSFVYFGVVVTFDDLNGNVLTVQRLHFGGWLAQIQS